MGYKNGDGENFKPLYIILPQISGFFKYFENNNNNKNVILADDDAILKHNKILTKNFDKKLLSAEFDSQPDYDKKYIKTRLKTFEDKVITTFTDNEIPKENTHYLCIAAICVDCVIKLEK